MAVMNGMGGIDQQITNRITSAGGNPQKLMGQYGDTKSILDLIAAQRAADLVKEQKQQVALAMNSNPATVADQLEKELVDGQKAEMRGPLEGLKNLRGDQAQGDKTRGVAGVLANQQRMAQQQRPTMNVAHGGITNAPAPNLNRMYNGGIVGYAEGGEISREEYIAKVKALIASGVAQEDAMAQLDAEFDILSGTREERRDVSLEDNRLLPKGNRRSIRGDEVYGTKALKPGFFMGKSTQGNQSYDESDPEGDLLAAIAGEKQPEVIGLPKRELGTTAMGMGVPSIQEDIVAPVDPTDAPVVKPEGIKQVLPEGNGMSPVMTRKERGEKELRDLGLDKKQDISALEPFMRKSEVNPNQSPIMTPKQQAEADKPLSGSAAIQAKLDAMRGKKGIAGLVERFANTSFTPTYGGTGEALAQAGRDIARTGKDEKAAERKFLEEQLGVQQGIEAEAIKAAEGTRQFGLTLGETRAARKEAGEQFTQRFNALNSQFDAKLKQDSKYQDAKLAVDRETNRIRAITESNQTSLLSANNKQQVFAILQTMRNDYDKMIEIEFQNILSQPGEDAEAKKAEAAAHREIRNAEFAKLQSSLVGTLNSDEGAGGGFSGFERE